MEEHAPRFNLSIVSSDVEVGGARLSAEYALSDEEIAIAHWWVLINCEEVKYWKELHQNFPEVDGDLEYHNMTFANYFRTWMDMIYICNYFLLHILERVSSIGNYSQLKVRPDYVIWMVK
ncbi:hypothetical protein ACLB2K_013445 [Fragaria x ananassa]